MHASVVVTETELRIVVKFDDDETAGGATIELFRASEKQPFAKATADKTGTCVLPRPEPGQYRVVAEEEMGHRATREFEVKANQETIAERPEQSRTTAIAIGLGVIVLLGIISFWSLRKPAPPTANGNQNGA